VPRELFGHGKDEAPPCRSYVQHQWQAAVRVGGAPIGGGAGGLVLCPKGVDVLPYPEGLGLQNMAAPSAYNCR